LCNASQEEVPPLASNISRSCDKPARELALNRKVVLINPFGNLIIRCVSPRSKGSVVRIADEVRAHCIHIDGIRPTVDDGVDQIALDGLQQISRLAGTVEDAESASNRRPRFG